MPPSPNSAIVPGDLVGLNEGRGAQLALVLAIRGTRADLCVGLEARSLSLPLRQLEKIAGLSEQDSLAPPAERLQQKPWCLDAAALAAAVPRRGDCGAAWMLLADGDQPLALGPFSELLAGSSTPLQRAACWLWLQGPQSLFRWRQQQVEARPLADLRRLRRERRRQQLAEQAQQRWQQAMRRRQPLDPDELEAPQRTELELLRRWAAGEVDQPLPTELQRCLQACHCACESGAIRHLLVDLGQWERHHLPSLESTTWQLGFSKELLAEAATLLARADQPQPGDERRQDLTGLHSVTIDDSDTLDIDDGLALERGGDGRLWVWIHVADPGRLIEADSPLDRAARRRGSSLYLAAGTLPMFPPELANGPFSLRMGQRNAAWSIKVALAEDGAVAEYEIMRSWVRPAYRLSYADADELIELAPPQEADLLDLHQLLQTRRHWRQQRGALVLDQPEGRIRAREVQTGPTSEVASEPTPELEVVEPSPSRLMVAEAMILAGAVVADHGLRHQLPLPYRSQQSSTLPPEQELQALPIGPVRHAALRRCLSRGHVGTNAAPHFSLGLEAYVQATSPIRRYGDLLVQRQLQAQLEGTTPLDESSLATLLNELEGPVRQGIQISREDQRHWLQVWFEQQQQQQWQALFLRWLRPQDRLALVHIEELAMDLAAECPARSEPGDALLVRIQLVDSLRDQLRLLAVG